MSVDMGDGFARAPVAGYIPSLCVRLSANSKWVFGQSRAVSMFSRLQSVGAAKTFILRETVCKFKMGCALLCSAIVADAIGNV